MGLVNRRSETAITVPGAQVRVVATTFGGQIVTRFGGALFASASPRHVEVQRDDGRVERTRVRDLDRLARLVVVALGIVTVRALRTRRSHP